jgi:hypothetical protein
MAMQGTFPSQSRECLPSNHTLIYLSIHPSIHLSIH